ncbi:MAG: hypothetical protein E3J21_17125 [Anaerolineales bacterium]|nr:MAG: hypothetical protein E3J21_17125 [Anaerolineales bacterium]
MNPGLSSREKEILNQVAGQLVSRKTAIASELHQALRATDMSNRLLISPRRLEEMAQEEVETFLHFLETGDEEETRQRGVRRASEGLGERSALAMTEALRRACWMANLDREALRVALEASGCYVNAFLEGYMSGREEDILKEQERTRHAFQRVLEKQTRS